MLVLAITFWTCASCSVEGETGNILRMLTLSRGNSLLRHFCHSYLPCSGIWWDSCWQTWAVERLVGQIYSPGAGETVCCRLFHTRTRWVYVWPYTIALSHDMLEELQNLCKVSKAAKAFFSWDRNSKKCCNHKDVNFRKDVGSLPASLTMCYVLCRLESTGDSLTRSKFTYIYIYYIYIIHIFLYFWFLVLRHSQQPNMSLYNLYTYISYM